MQIEDGKGTGKQVAVSSDNRLDVNAKSMSRAFYISRDKFDTYSWTTVSYDAAAGDTILLVCNNSTTQNLHITKLYAWADVATQFKIHAPAYPTLAGTAVVGLNQNRSSGKLANASAYANETGNTFAAANVLLTMRNNETATDEFAVQWDFEGTVILGYHNSIAIDVIADAAAVECTIVGFFE
jgi:hypothetical protein